MTELLPIATTAMLACLSIAVFGIVPSTVAFGGFSSDIIFMVIGMLIVGNALFETGVAHKMGKSIISMVGTNEKLFIAALIVVSVIISLFLSNTATASIMMPVVASAVAASKGKFTKKGSYMIVGFSAVAGGGLTVIGSTPQIIAQAMLMEGGHETMGFFEISHIGIPKILILIIYYLTIGYVLQKKVFNFPDPVDDTQKVAAASSTEEKPKSGLKMAISVAVLGFCVTGFLTGLWTLGIVAMVGAAICVLTGCISQKRVFSTMDWTSVVVLGSSLGIAAALDQSGAGRLVAQAMINIIGDRMTPFILCVVLALLAVILGNIMSHTATASILMPLSIILAMELGYDVKSVVVAVVVAANVTYMTPISTPPITMTLAGGYRFMDYVKVGGLINLLSFILVILMFPLVLNV